jgi:hypothetical protein
LVTDDALIIVKFPHPNPALHRSIFILGHSLRVRSGLDPPPKKGLLPDRESSLPAVSMISVNRRRGSFGARLIRIKAVLHARPKIALPRSNSPAFTASSFVVVHRRRIQHGHVALGTIS